MGTTCAATFEGFLADATHLDHVRPPTLHAYHSEFSPAVVER